MSAPAVFHITHHKAGSQWIMSILQDAAPERFVPPLQKVAHVVNGPLLAGKVYPTVYLTRPKFEALDLPAPHRKFIVIRDLRDTLVSLYFGLRVHHALFHDEQRAARDFLNDHDIETGLLFLINERLERSADRQRSWVGSGELTFHYEDLIADQFAGVTRILEHCEFALPPERIRAIVDARSFKNMAGRKPGEENIHSHQRKGVAGDWQTHFTDNVKDAFKQRYAQLLIDTGYETTTAW
jgi:lipopolysaccharide transport system ATP-binding protein